jgi:hypothetical protein
MSMKRGGPANRPDLRPELPADLPPLDQRAGEWPLDEPLESDQVRAALWHGAGNVTRAAKLLKVSPARLGHYLRRMPALREERLLAAEMIVDRAEGVILDAMADTDDPVRQDNAARFVLERIGRARGWGTAQPAPGGGLSVNFGGEGKSGALAIRWETDASPDTPLADVADGLRRTPEGAGDVGGPPRIDHDRTDKVRR